MLGVGDLLPETAEMYLSTKCQRAIAILSVAFCLVVAFCQLLPAVDPGTAPIDRYRIIHVYPHDPDAFTQGLVFCDGFLYESTGLLGKSSLRKVDLQNGKVLQSYALAPNLFGEGLTVWEENLIQLTWKNQRGFVYDRSNFQLLRTFDYAGEGWGLTQDGKNLILSDGTSALRFLNPQTFMEERRLEVTDAGRPVKNINELEFINGQIYANIWQSAVIARISPDTGRVLGWIDLGGIHAGDDSMKQADVLNGIAYDPKGNRLFVTGKRWSKLFEIEVLPQASANLQ